MYIIVKGIYYEENMRGHEGNQEERENMKGGTSPEVLKARESWGEPRVGRVRGSGPCRGVIGRPGGSRHDTIEFEVH